MTTPSPPSRWSRSWQAVRRLWSRDDSGANLEQQFEAVRAQVPSPVFWLVGKTQSGKSSVVRYLTGADEAQIGSGFRPCTKTSRLFPFPNADAPVLTFLDTRGVDEPSYDPTEDLAAFDQQAHLMMVTNRLTDFSHAGVRSALDRVRKANQARPVILLLTCWHEAHPTQQHPQPYPFDPLASPIGEAPVITGPVADDVVRLVREQAERFRGLVDRIVPLDLTKPEEGYTDPHYGGPMLKRVLLDSLPSAYRTSFARVSEVTDTLKDAHWQQAMPIILGYSSLAATAGGFPIPFVDLLVLPAIQSRMIQALSAQSGRPESGARFLETAASVGLGLVARQAIREIVKFIPGVGAAAGAALAGASTYALGRAYCLYDQEVHQGHVPDAAALKKLYQDQLQVAERAWK